MLRLKFLSDAILIIYLLIPKIIIYLYKLNYEQIIPIRHTKI